MRWTYENGGKIHSRCGSKAEAVRRFDLARNSVYWIWPPPKKCVGPETKLGTLAQTRSKKTPGACPTKSRRHPQRTANRLWRQPSCDLGAAGTTGLHVKKLIKYRERNEVQRWPFGRELEKLNGQAVFYLDECGVDHLYREYGRSPWGERIYQAVAGKRRERTNVIAASQHGKLVAPLAFQGSCNTDVVGVYFEKVLLPALPPGSVIVLGNGPVSSVANNSRNGWKGLAAGCCSHRQPLPFYRQYLPVLLLIAIGWHSFACEFILKNPLRFSGGDFQLGMLGRGQRVSASG